MWKKITTDNYYLKAYNTIFWNDVLYVVVCLSVSLLSNFWLIHHPRLLYQPHIGLMSGYMWSITPDTAKVGRSYSHVRSPGFDCWFSDRFSVATGVSKPLCRRLTLTFTLISENLSLYITLLHYWSLTKQPTLLSSWLQLLSYKV